MVLSGSEFTAPRKEVMECGSSARPNLETVSANGWGGIKKKSMTWMTLRRKDGSVALLCVSYCSPDLPSREYNVLLRDHSSGALTGYEHNFGWIAGLHYRRDSLSTRDARLARIGEQGGQELEGRI